MSSPATTPALHLTPAAEHGQRPGRERAASAAGRERESRREPTAIGADRARARARGRAAVSTCPVRLRFMSDAAARSAAEAVGPRLDGLAASSASEEESANVRGLPHKLAIGHQEIDRIVDEVEQIYSSQPTEWLPLEPVGRMMLHEMYEDIDELEDALGGSFEAFLNALPHFETRRVPSAPNDASATEEEGGRVEFKVLAPDPDAPPTVLTLHVASRSDLWRVLHKSADAALRIPHLEFEIGADSKRRIDSVYNHISTAVWNLGAHLRAQVGVGDAATAGAATDDATSDAANILATVDALEALLDVEEPFDVVVDDPTGVSSFKPNDGVDVLTL